MRKCVALMWHTRNYYRILVGELIGRQNEDAKLRYYGGFYTGSEDVRWAELIQHHIQCRSVMVLKLLAILPEGQFVAVHKGGEPYEPRKYICMISYSLLSIAYTDRLLIGFVAFAGSLYSARI
jgi:hypothetical protein